VAELRYKAWGETRYTYGTTPTTYKFTGQRLDDSTGLYYYGARYYDPALGRFIAPDTIVPEPGNPQALNRYAYVYNNPVRYTDPTGHWTEEELAAAFGPDWRDKYFGKGAAFEGRDKLLEFLISKQTTNQVVLEMVRSFFEMAGAAHSRGMGFENIDALGARIAFTGGAAGFAGLSGDAILNLTSGEFSGFLSPEVGFIIGESVQLVGGLTLLANLPSNEAYRGTFMAVGVVGGAYGGLNAEAFWSSPMSDRFNAFDKANGGFFGAGPAIPGLGGYGSISYSFEVFREDARGSHAFPHHPNPLDVVGHIGSAITHDILLHPLLPWSPYRR